MKLAIVLGSRPEIIKLPPTVKELARRALLLLKYLVAEEITGVVDENEIARIDEELKENIWEEMRQKWKL
jgi:UDP-N-acetylglucosamine 2-epimerase